MSICLFVFIAGSTLAYTQAENPSRPAKEEQQFKGYTIRLLPFNDGTYGYDILKGKTMLLNQMRNPFNGSPTGLNNKEDVYKVAKWQIENMLSKRAGNGRMLQKNDPGFSKLPPSLRERLNKMPQARAQYIQHRLPLSVAEQLHITVNR